LVALVLSENETSPHLPFGSSRSLLTSS